MEARMNFYERFEQLCAHYKQGPISPAGLELEKLMKAQGVTSFSRTTAAKWKEIKNIPRCDYIIALANIFETSTDYLLGRTEDIIDHTKSAPVLTDKQKRLLQAFAQLDGADQSEAIQYIDFKAGQDKYKKASVTA